ncbi:MauE/DoxX family redox-associated membrane protein [Sphingomonas bacterium]|uniref:MauE/DoxX family redox-associated membrane protein n=1 Tax=Sphingomonas bacterium TaxID=1895847 RepID=UPI0015750F5E|nr:MauE/DoxX family redox-associated membrane protein [Sphingomonas bacterium]
MALVFLVAAAAKLRHRATLAGVIGNYRLLPSALVGPTALVLPWLEVLVGAMLLVGERRWVPAIAALLLVIFAAAMAINIGRGRRRIDCGCGVGGLRQSLHGALVARNLALAVALLLNLSAGQVPLYGHVAAIATGLALFLLILLLDALLAVPGFRAQQV